MMLLNAPASMAFKLLGRMAFKILVPVPVND